MALSVMRTPLCNSFIFDAAQNRDGIVFARLIHEDGLKATGESRIFSMYFWYSPSVVPTQRNWLRERAGFSMFAASKEPLARSARADERVQFINKQNHFAYGLFDLITAFKRLRIRHGTSLQSTTQYPKRGPLCPSQRFGNIARRRCAGPALRRWRFFPYQLHRSEPIVLAATKQDLHDTTNSSSRPITGSSFSWRASSVRFWNIFPKPDTSAPVRGTALTEPRTSLSAFKIASTVTPLFFKILDFLTLFREGEE